MSELHEQALFPSRRRAVGRRNELRPTLFLSRERIGERTHGSLLRFEAQTGSALLLSSGPYWMVLQGAFPARRGTFFERFRQTLIGLLICKDTLPDICRAPVAKVS